MLKQNPKWGSRDRRFIAETTYGIVRWWRLLNEILGETTTNRFYKLIGIYQLLNGHDLPDWEEFDGLEKVAILEVALISVKQVRNTEKLILIGWMSWMVKELGEEVCEKESCALEYRSSCCIESKYIKNKKLKFSVYCKSKKLRLK
ncbi:MAG: hypothetical protein IPH89_08870 [Bacteroidetes bacterium]|nr:hypothetical protein [Bacteroidota bacterium]